MTLYTARMIAAKPQTAVLTTLAGNISMVLQVKSRKGRVTGPLTEFQYSLFITEQNIKLKRS